MKDTAHQLRRVQRKILRLNRREQLEQVNHNNNHSSIESAEMSPFMKRYLDRNNALR